MGTANRGREWSQVSQDECLSVLEEPGRYQVVMLNDDYTPMEFVMVVLERFFGMNGSDALNTMLTVHHYGRAVCGVYTKDVAETKVLQVHTCARQQGYPLMCEVSLSP